MDNIKLELERTELNELRHIVSSQKEALERELKNTPDVWFNREDRAFLNDSIGYCDSILEKVEKAMKEMEEMLKKRREIERLTALEEIRKELM